MKLLLCEDERELSNALVKILTNFNYSVDAVYDGRQALEYLDVEEYDAVLLDIMMPYIDGIEVLKTIRKQGNNVPVIMLTAKSTIENKVSGLDFGANDYITKPFDIKELLARIRAVTRVNTSSKTSIISVGNLNLDRNTYELSTTKDVVKLVGKEYQMMEMLMINKGIIISTEKFMQKIWGYNSESEINVVWVYISNLRKKLIQIESNVKIKATRNTGYSLEVLEC